MEVFFFGANTAVKKANIFINLRVMPLVAANFPFVSCRCHAFLKDRYRSNHFNLLYALFIWSDVMHMRWIKLQ